MPSRRMKRVTSRRMTSKQMTSKQVTRRRMTSKQMTNGRMTRMPLMLLPSLALDTGHINPVDNTGCLLQHWADHRLHLSISECVSVPQPTTQLVSVPQPTTQLVCVRTFKFSFCTILHLYLNCGHILPSPPEVVIMIMMMMTKMLRLMLDRHLNVSPILSMKYIHPNSSA